MYSRSITPNGFDAPIEYITKKFVLRPLTIDYVDEDYEVVMSSVDHLYKLMDNSESVSYTHLTLPTNREV